MSRKFGFRCGGLAAWLEDGSAKQAFDTMIAAIAARVRNAKLLMMDCSQMRKVHAFSTLFQKAGPGVYQNTANP
jgi:hypothetical protein